MIVSTFDLFMIGIGPSSSHTVGPMKAANMFITDLQTLGLFDSVDRLHAEMFGSLGSTGRGHGTPKAVLMGLEGELPDTVEVASIIARVEAVKETGVLKLNGTRTIEFDYDSDLVLNKRESLPLHPNGMTFKAFNAAGEVILDKSYYSVGGGFVANQDDQELHGDFEDASKPVPYPFNSGEELLALCNEHNKSIADLMWENECALQSASAVREQILKIWGVMQESVKNGCATDGILPGGLHVKRRAPGLKNKLTTNLEKHLTDPLIITDWVTLYALAVNEENAGGGRIVTAPTNGAAGIIPAVLHYYMRFVPGASEQGIIQFMLTAAAIGVLYKKNASISGAEVGCQGEVGSACSMAAGALCAVSGGTPEQVENAAEIAMEHNLGLTCDPIGGLVQVPCIERNAMAAIKAISANRMALQGDGSHFVSLDKVIKTMRKTGLDMHSKYKETARGGLATNVLEVPVNIIDC